MRTHRRLHRFVFDATMRGVVTLGGGAVLAGNTGHLTLATGIPSGTARTPLWSPASAERFDAIEVVTTTPTSGGRSPTQVRLRLRDSVGEAFWNGTAWVAAGADDWNEISEVEAHLSTWLLERLKRELGFVVVLDTAVVGVAAVVEEIRVVWSSSRDPQEDALVRGFLPVLKATAFPIDVVGKAVAVATSALTVTGLGVETPYKNLVFDAVFDHVNDPGHMRNLLVASGSTTATLSPAIPPGGQPWAVMLAAPTVAITTSQDFREIATTPSVEVISADLSATNHGVRDAVVERVSGRAFAFPSALQGDLDLVIELVADKQRDLQRLVDAARRQILANKLMRLPGSGEMVRLHLAPQSTYAAAPDQSDLVKTQINVTLMGLVLAIEDVVDGTAVTTVIAKDVFTRATNLVRFGEATTAPTTAAGIRALRGARRTFDRAFAASFNRGAGKRLFLATPSAMGLPRSVNIAETFTAEAIDVDVDGVLITVWGTAPVGGGAGVIEVF